MNIQRVHVIEKLPLVFLILMAASWWHFFNYDTWLNDFGQSKSDWLLLIDIGVTLPLLCFICIKPKKIALIKSIGYFALLVAVGSYIIPIQYQVVWPYLTNLRYLILCGFIVVELSVIACVIFAIKQAITKGLDPDFAIEKPIKRFIGDSAISKLIIFETRVWSFIFCSRLIHSSAYEGDEQFSYHLKDANQSNSLGFILMIAFEIPLMHLVLHFIWSPLAANIVTLLTALSLVFFVAEYLAMSRRPISIDDRQIYLRYGVFNVFTIALDNIKTIEFNQSVIRRQKGVKRYNFSGAPNIHIVLKTEIDDAKQIYIGVDSPKKMISLVQHRIN
ncbi:PH domain-containing protein [Shewanella japonica]|uniref:PH domain-containing protein n=1 Tax=Shewanella japonica TaxID=93973 RepID=UPI000E76B5FF|nr:PH domain-containing protein [Shewanella japonica]